MLQQTQVQTAIPYWERWMTLFPTPAALAAADEPTVLKAWEGLGYYSRARNLHKAARQLVQSGTSSNRQCAADWIELPGIGPYTAGAISSIAFNQAEPIVDGNVIRVLSRIHALTGNPLERANNRRLWDLAHQWVQAGSTATVESRPPLLLAGPCSALNQALMELGATLCTPRAPGCRDCPVNRHCRAHQLGRPEAFPELPPRVPVTPLRRVAMILRHQNQVAVRQRAAGEVNGGFWEFPELDLSDSTLSAAAAAAAWTGLSTTQFEVVPGFKHSITRYRIQLEVVRTRLTQRPRVFPGNESGGLRWMATADLDTLPFTGAHRKLIPRVLTQD